MVCHLGLGFGFNFGSINAARLGRRMICGYNACCGWNKYILKFRRDPPIPLPTPSLSPVWLCAGGTLALLISAAGFYEASMEWGVSLSLSLDSS